MPTTVGDIAGRLRSRRAVYDASWRADVDRLTREHDAAAVEEALARLEAAL